MTSDFYGRFIFIGFEDLKDIKFEKLEQVCDKVFVLVNKEEKAIPFYLVQQLQKLGEHVQWIPVVGKSGEGFPIFLAYFLGKNHHQFEKDIEFAIISEDQGLDSLIDYLNEDGRNTIRVTRKKEKKKHTSDLKDITWSTSKEKTVKEQQVEIKHAGTTNGEVSNEDIVLSATSAQSQQLSERIARETIKRLIMSGNRPAAIDALKSYILLQYNNVDVNKNIDLIIRKLEKMHEIEVKNKEVVYNF